MCSIKTYITRFLAAIEYTCLKPFNHYIWVFEFCGLSRVK